MINVVFKLHVKIKYLIKERMILTVVDLAHPAQMSADRRLKKVEMTHQAVEEVKESIYLMEVI